MGMIQCQMKVRGSRKAGVVVDMISGREVCEDSVRASGEDVAEGGLSEREKTIREMGNEANATGECTWDGSVYNL